MLVFFAELGVSGQSSKASLAILVVPNESSSFLAQACHRSLLADLLAADRETAPAFTVTHDSWSGGEELLVDPFLTLRQWGTRVLGDCGKKTKITLRVAVLKAFA